MPSSRFHAHLLKRDHRVAIAAVACDPWAIPAGMHAGFRERFRNRMEKEVALRNAWLVEGESFLRLAQQLDPIGMAAHVARTLSFNGVPDRVEVRAALGNPLPRRGPVHIPGKSPGFEPGELAAYRRRLEAEKGKRPSP